VKGAQRRERDIPAECEKEGPKTRKLLMTVTIIAIALTPSIGIGTAHAHGFGGGGFHGGGFGGGGFHGGGRRLATEADHRASARRSGPQPLAPP
jgi:hypothetical protein